MFRLLCTLIAVVGVKYYTSVGLRQLDRRLLAVKRDLERTKSGRAEKLEEQREAAAEEDLYEVRIRNMKELISDLEYRLAMKSEAEEQNA